MKISFLSFPLVLAAKQRSCSENSESGYSTRTKLAFSLAVSQIMRAVCSMRWIWKPKEMNRLNIIFFAEVSFYATVHRVCTITTVMVLVTGLMLENVMKEDGLAHRPCASFTERVLKLKISSFFEFITHNSGCQEDDRAGYCDQTTEWPMYLNDDTTCTGYVKCDEFGQQFRVSVPDGLMWNRGACDWPSENPGACCMENGGAHRPCP